MLLTAKQLASEININGLNDNEVRQLANFMGLTDVDISIVPVHSPKWASRSDRYLVWVDFFAVSAPDTIAIGIVKDRAIDSHRIVRIYKKESRPGCTLEYETIASGFNSVDLCWSKYLEYKSGFAKPGARIYRVDINCTMSINLVAINETSAKQQLNLIQHNIEATYCDHRHQRIPASIDQINLIEIS